MLYNSWEKIVLENKTKKKRKINSNLIFNLIVAALSVYLIFNFIFTEDGLIDLLHSSTGIKFGWIGAAVLVFDLNIVLDGLVTLVYIRSQYPKFRFIDALKVACVGVFFGAVTPSNTGGQPMQLYLMSKMHVNVGFGSACMTQKFIVYQLVTTSFSIFAVIVKFDFFREAFTNFWSSAFIVLGFTVQLALTALLLVVSFSEGITKKLVRLIYKILRMLKFIKNPVGIIRRVTREFDNFLQSNRMLMGNKKRLAMIFGLVFLQMICILSVPFFVYISFEMPQLAAKHHQPVGNYFDFLCIQSFVLFTSNLVPLPGASGGAELAFTMYFGRFFSFGKVNKIKPAILFWRFVTYYGAILLTLPFSYYTKDRKNQKQLEETAASAESAEEEG